MKIDEMLAIAQDATPGPWVRGSRGGRCTLPHPEDNGSHGKGKCDYRLSAKLTDPDHDISAGGKEGDPYESQIRVCGNYNYEEGGVISGYDATHIAAFDPPTVIAILTELKAALGVVSAATFAAEHMAQDDDTRYGRSAVVTAAKDLRKALADYDAATADPTEGGTP